MPRRVALVNAADDGRAGAEAVGRLRVALAADPDFDPLPGGAIARSLEEPLPAAVDQAARAAARADELIAAAQDARSRFDDEKAMRLLTEAERLLLRARPTPDVVARLAEVNFQLGLVYMTQNDARSAGDAFSAVHRLDPSRGPLDPARYLPDVVKAFEAALVPQAKTADLAVDAAYDGATVYIDGARAGETPFAGKVEPGIHYVWAEFAGHEPAGARVVANRGQPAVVELPLRPLATSERLRDARRRVIAGAGGAGAAGVDRGKPAYAALAREVADRIGVRDVIVVATRPEGLSAALYDATTGKLGGWILLSPRGTGDVIARLPGRPGVVEPGTRDAGPSGGGERPWWRNPLVWGGAGAGAVVLTVVGVAILANSDGDSVSDRAPVTCCDFATSE